MNIREVTKQVRDVMTGRSGHDTILVWKEGRSWKCESSVGLTPTENCLFFQHEINDISLKEVEQQIRKLADENLRQSTEFSTGYSEYEKKHFENEKDYYDSLEKEADEYIEKAGE